MPRYAVEILEHINHRITVDAQNEDAAMAEADRQLNELPATTYPPNFESVVALIDTTNVEELEPFVCPSAVAGGREDRCGLFSFPRRCEPGACTMPDARFGWSGLCEEDPDEPGRCAYHRSVCTVDGPGAEMPR